MSVRVVPDHLVLASGEQRPCDKALFIAVRSLFSPVALDYLLPPAGEARPKHNKLYNTGQAEAKSLVATLQARDYAVVLVGENAAENGNATTLMHKVNADGFYHFDDKRKPDQYFTLAAPFGVRASKTLFVATSEALVTRLDQQGMQNETLRHRPSLYYSAHRSTIGEQSDAQVVKKLFDPYQDICRAYFEELHGILYGFDKSLHFPPLRRRKQPARKSRGLRW